MAKYTILGCCCFLLLQAAQAQQVPMDSLLPYTRLLKEVPGFPVKASPLRQAMLDSLNRRSLQAYVDQPGNILQMAGGQLNRQAAGQFARYISATAGKERLQQLQEAYAIGKDTAKLLRYLDGKLRGFYALRPQTGLGAFKGTDLVKAAINTASAGIYHDNSAGAVNSVYTNAAIKGVIALGGIPFAMNYTNLAGRGNTLSDIRNAGLVKAAFDRDAYLEGLSAKVKSQYDLKKYFLEDIDL